MMRRDDYRVVEITDANGETKYVAEVFRPTFFGLGASRWRRLHQYTVDGGVWYPAHSTQADAERQIAAWTGSSTTSWCEVRR